MKKKQKKKEKTTQFFNMNLHDETLSNFSLLLIILAYLITR